MDEYESLSHSKWECKYHVVFIPKCRREALYQELRRHLGEVPLVMDTSTRSCGDSRFGCWVCTLVDEDKSMRTMNRHWSAAQSSYRTFRHGCPLS